MKFFLKLYLYVLKQVIIINESEEELGKVSLYCHCSLSTRLFGQNLKQIGYSKVNGLTRGLVHSLKSGLKQKICLLNRKVRNLKLAK